jgi:hypothetical protein
MSDSRAPGSEEDRALAGARRLPREIAPERDLWPAIEARLEQPGAEAPGRRGLRWGSAIAAGAVLVAVSSLLTVWIVERDDMRSARLTVPTAIGPATVQPATFGPGHPLGPAYRLARNELATDLEDRLDALPPASRSVVRRNLAQIRGALDEINTALADDPNNVLLQQLLLAAYQDELAVLTEMNRMARSLPTRKEI